MARFGSLVICLLCFHLFNISINIISLSGLILGIGLMIDNSIIVIDNITQYRQMGYSLDLACVKGTNEVVRPLLGSALTTCAVFIPLIFLSGITGALFYDQAMAITIGLFISLMVSFTLLPVLYRLFHLKNGGLYELELFMQKWNTLDNSKLYKKGFRLVMKKQYVALGVFAVLCCMTIVLFFLLPKSQMPHLTSTEALISIDWNEPINVEENKQRTHELLLPLEGFYKEYTAQVGHQQFLLDKNTDVKSSKTVLYVHSENQKELENSKELITFGIRKKYPKAIIDFQEVDNIFSLIFSDDTPPLVANLRNVENVGSSQTSRLKELWNTIHDQLPFLKIQAIAWEDYISLKADKEKLMTYGISSEILNNTLKSAFNENEIFSIIDNQNFVPIKLGGEEMTIKNVLNQTMVRANDSTYHVINNFISETQTEDLNTITAGREGEYYPINLRIGLDEEEAVRNVINSIVNQNPHYNVLFTGSLSKNRKLIKELAIVMSITLLLLFFILATQFESLVLPFIILLEIPIAMAGGFLFLYLFGMGINLMSMIGIVVMSGIIINDSILKIDTIIQLQKQGYTTIEALLVAGQRRLKPILMTSLTTILALIPILFISGLGGELQAPLAMALIGGMLFGTFVSLYFIPLCYYYLAVNRIHVI